MGDRPLAIAITQVWNRQGIHRGRSVRRSVLRVVVGCRADGRLEVQPGTGGLERVLVAESIDGEGFLASVHDGFGVAPVAGATPFELPSAAFAAGWPAVCWLDHPNPLATPATARALLETVEWLAATLESP